MSNPKVATEFDKIIQADRQRKKNEQLASQIFSRNKPKTQLKKDNNKQAPRPGSLASRVGVAKRSSSTSSNTSLRPQASRTPSSVSQHARQNRLAAEINNNASANVISSPKPAGQGLSIKGSAAPFVVEARNFAPGTTDADIESAIQQDCIDGNGINALVSCKIMSTKPTVVAELVFNERSVADTIISKYHKQRADGQTLELTLARSGPGSISKYHKKAPPARAPTPPSTIPVLTLEESNVTEDVDMEQESASVAHDPYENEREAAARDRRDRESQREREDYDTTSINDNNNNTTTSSNSNRRRDGERKRDGRDERDRDGDDREREQDRKYENRDASRTYDRHEESRNGRPSHYGNGVGAPSRPAYGSGYAGGRGNYPNYGGNSYGGRGGYSGPRYRGFGNR